MNEQEVRTLLDDLAGTPAPPPRVDVSRAVTVARRQTRVRTWTSIAAASVLVVGLAVGTTYAVNTGPPESTQAAVAAAPARFDPLVEYATFGWLPDEDKLNSRFTSVNAVRFATQVRQYVPDPAQPMASLPGASINVSFYAAGKKPESELPLELWGPDNNPSVPYAPVTDAPAVNGKEAHWVTVPDDPETIVLKWRYAPDAWAEVTVSRIDGDLRQSAHRVASEVRFGGTERLRFPFHLTGLPAGGYPVASTFAEGGLDAPWRVDLILGTEGDKADMTVSVSPMDASQHSPNTTVDGYQAHRQTLDASSGPERVAGMKHSDMLSIYDVAGLDASIVINARSDAADAARFGPDGSVGVFRTLTVHPDPSDWTDQPLR